MKRNKIVLILFRIILYFLRFVQYTLDVFSVKAEKGLVFFRCGVRRIQNKKEVIS